MSYEEYRTKPFADIKRADELLNGNGGGTPNSHEIQLAQALIALAQAKMTGRGRA